MLTLSTNASNIATRIFSFCLMLAVVFMLIKYGLHDPGNNHTIGIIKAGDLLYVLMAIMALGLVIITVSLFGVIKVIIEESTGVITVISIFRRRSLAVNEIDHYFITSNRTRTKVFEGILLSLKTGGKIQLTGQNLLSIAAFKTYLIKKNVNCKGEKKMIFPFR